MRKILHEHPIVNLTLIPGMLFQQDSSSKSSTQSVQLFTETKNRRVAKKEELVPSDYFIKSCGLLIDSIFTTYLLLGFIISIPFVWLFNLLRNPGPLFYKQQRVGKDGKIFDIIKYRSMRVNAEADGIARFALPNDERITPVGSFLRKSRIDELPQVINILKGEMMLIGPRPERPEFVKEFIKKNPNYRLRSLVKPGVTGWGQVKYKYTTTLEEGLTKLEYDLHFIKHRNFRMDLEIVGRTAILIISGKGN